MGYGAGGCDRDPARVKILQKAKSLGVRFVSFRSLLGIGRMQVLVLALPRAELGDLRVPLVLCPSQGDTCWRGWASLAHLCRVTGLPSSSPCLKQPPGEPRRHFRSCWELLASKQTQNLSPCATALLQRHLPGAIGTVGTAGLARDRPGTAAAASPAPILHRAGCFQLLSPGAWLLPRTSVWQSRRPAKEPCVASGAGGER